MEIIVSSGSGIETAAKIELRKLGIDAPCHNGKFIFNGNEEDIVKLNLNLRTCDRVYIRLACFTAMSFDELYDYTRDIAWVDIIPADAAIIVNAKSVDSKLYALSAIQSIVKKAIVDKLKVKYPVLLESGAAYNVEIRVIKNEVWVMLDTSGEPLHKRGYRKLVGEAPIKETIAAAIINLSVWNPDRPLIDPFTGSGTIPIEAAMIALNMAPGINRNFAFEHFNFIDKERLVVARKQAYDMIDWDRKLKIYGYDINYKAIQLAMTHAENIKLEKYIHFEKNDMRNIATRQKYGVIICNPPYGERLMEEKDIKILYSDFGKMYRSLDSWSCYVITSYYDFEKYFGLKSIKNRKIFNANLECRLYQYLGKKPLNKDYDTSIIAP